MKQAPRTSRQEAQSQKAGFFQRLWDDMQTRRRLKAKLPLLGSQDRITKFLTLREFVDSGRAAFPLLAKALKDPHSPKRQVAAAVAIVELVKRHPDLEQRALTLFIGTAASDGEAAAALSLGTIRILAGKNADIFCQYDVKPGGTEFQRLEATLAGGR